jgi:hypothetical protein
MMIERELQNTFENSLIARPLQGHSSGNRQAANK